ncbi:hypothetical protein MFRU_011g01020 [Monilinia fructicola]|uniref:Mid2 domain-containing protein n=1 Tax=Monilinia fructicola TaxID=38448 RepID=A0A5M9JMV6_MONFR|nr:hypothetical protein EYC84_000230 [Monilinia fructicola]KAG4030644.1 hypothetical protein MFRU_011g01020 [Monilinia fructicola]
MSPFLILLSFSTIFRLTNAIPWAAAEQTATYKPDEWSPRPTNTILKARGLFERGSIDVDVCGWIGGNLAQPVGCATGSSCIHDTSFGFVGCCPTSSAGADPIPCTDGLYTTCIDHNSAGYASNSLFVNNGVLSCPANSNCYKINYPQNYIQFGCGPSTANVTAATTFSGQATDLNLQIVYTGVTFNPTITIQNPSNFGAATLFSTSTTGSLTQSTASAVAGKGSLTASAPEYTSSAAAESKGSSNTGAIIGGIVGALVVIIGSSVVAFFLIHKKGNERKSSVHRDTGSPERSSKENFESVPNPKPFSYPVHSPIPLSHQSPEPQNHYSQMSGTNNLGYAPVFQSPYHRPITPVGHDRPVEAPTPDLHARNFRSPSPAFDPFQPPHSEILPESYDPSRLRGPPSSEPYRPSQSPEPQNYYPQSPDPEHLPCYHPSSPEPQALRPRPSRSPPLGRSPTPVFTTSPYTLPPTTDLPPLDIMDDIQTPIAPKPSPANWHLALTGDRRTYAPADGTSTSADHQHAPMPDMPALYADITTAMGAESMSPPNDTFLPRQNSDATKPGTRRNFSRKGRAARKGTEDLHENETEEEAARSNNVRQSGWVPSGLRTRNSPSPHSASRMPDARVVRRHDEVAAQRDQSGDQLGEEVRIAYNPNNPHAGLNIEYWGPPRVVGIGRHPRPAMDPHAVEGGWL